MGDLAYYVSVIALSVSVVALSRAREADRRADELYWDYIRLWGARPERRGGRRVTGEYLGGLLAPFDCPPSGDPRKRQRVKLTEEAAEAFADTFAFAHRHEPTVEDVLRQFAHVGIRIAAKHGIEAGEIDFYADEEAIAEYAAKLRLADDGKEQ